MAKKANPTDNMELDEQQSASKPVAGNANQYRYIYTRKSVERRIRRRRVALVLLIFVLVATLLAGATYAVLSFVDYNSFRVTITQGKAVLTLSNDEAFSEPTSQLSTGSAKSMLDTTYNELPHLTLRNTDGSYAGAHNFFGSSFYLRNTSDTQVTYNMRILVTDVYNDLDACIRVLVIREELQLNEDGEWELLSATQNDSSHLEYVCYGKARTVVEEDGETREQVAYPIDRNGQPMADVYDPNPDAEKNTVWYCTNFTDPKVGAIADRTYHTLQPWQKVRYTVAIWLEGSDPDTTNEKLGGTLTMTVSFNAVDSAELEVDE